jgi:hypothetical protein
MESETQGQAHFELSQALYTEAQRRHFTSSITYRRRRICWTASDGSIGVECVRLQGHFHLLQIFILEAIYLYYHMKEKLPNESSPIKKETKFSKDFSSIVKRDEYK